MRPLCTLTLAGFLILAAGANAGAQPDKGKRPPVDTSKGQKGAPPVPVAPATRAPIKDRLDKIASLVNGNKFNEYDTEDHVLGLDLLQADPDKLLAELNAAIRTAPNDPYLYKTRALVYLGKLDGDRFRADLEKVLTFTPRTNNDRLLRADALTLLWRNKDAVKELDAMLKADPENPIYLNFRAVALFQDGQNDASLKDLDRAIKLLPGSATFHYNRGTLMRRLGKQEEAVADYTRAIDLFALPTMHTNRGNCYTSLGKTTEALADYAKAIELAPRHAFMAYYNRGYLYEALKQPQHALDDYSAAIKLNPQYRDAYVNRAGLYMDARKYDLAVADCNAALRIDPANLSATFNRGASLYALGRHKDALRDLNKAIELVPRLALAYRKRAEVYRALGETVKADADQKTADALSAPR